MPIIGKVFIYLTDADTIASQLQQKLAPKYQVINGGMNGNDTVDNFNSLESFKKKKIQHLVYIICENDLNTSVTEGKAKDRVLSIVEKLKAYEKDFTSITIVLNLYIYQVMPYIFDPGESKRLATNMEQINTSVQKSLSKKMKFINWYDLANDYRAKSKTIFAPFALYVDHVHFSPLGNGLVAEAIFQDSF